MSDIADRQKCAFQDRLKRISEGGPNTMGQVYCGIAEETAPKTPPKLKKDKRGRIVVNSPARNALYPLSIAGSAVLGAASVVIARYVRWHLTSDGLAGDDPDLAMMIDAGMAMAVAFFLRMLFRMEAKELMAAKTVGIVAMVCVMHNFVHAWPGLFDVMFAPEWTNDVIASTDANSILFRGVSFLLSAPDTAVAETAPALPQLVEMNN